MRITILILLSMLFVAGCSTQRTDQHPWGNDPEPSSDWIIQHYDHQLEVAVNQRRVVEGW